MANWAYVKDNSVVELHDLLPVSWRHVSGLRKSADNLPFLLSLGWMPVDKQYQNYDPDQLRIVGYDHMVAGARVVETLILSPVEKPSFEQLKAEFLTELRNKRNELLKDSDWTQLLDIQNVFSEQLRLAWQTYRQQLRDLPELYLDNDVISLDQVIWPQTP